MKKISLWVLSLGLLASPGCAGKKKELAAALPQAVKEEAAQYGLPAPRTISERDRRRDERRRNKMESTIYNR